MSQRTMYCGFIFALAVSVAFWSCQPTQLVISDYDADFLTDWNKEILEVAMAEDGLLTLKGLRTAAMTHVAVHDALNSIEPVYERYALKERVTRTYPANAAAYAAYVITTRQYPDQAIKFQSLLDAQLAASNHQDTATARVLGEAAALAILERRQNDRWNGEAEYTWHPMAPGVYAEFNEHSGTPEGFIFGAGWAKAEPFMLPSQDHFRSPPPPEIESDEYTEAFNEVKEVGATNSSTRTDDQAHLAMWWKDFVENSHNRLVRDLVKKEELNLWDAARVFALMNMAIYDAYINVFDNKFYYNHWRPYTAIRWAEFDGNDDTEPDTSWNNLHEHTYAFPSYPSAHGTASSAAMTVLANTLGTGDDYQFVMRTDSVDRAGPFSG
ncbi:MAG: vanadium-dependent haloperoxidase, partial [Saprospiraceae bacterium]|nr:vanadium-dependent haloperoxidase [Saprospiraceae bacterium]